MWYRSMPVALLPVSQPASVRARVVSRALVALASAAGLTLIGIAVVAPAALSAGMPVALLFYPVLWTAAIAAVRRY